ncbi:MAG: 16S rRNA (guanine(966)-N(2))-methyltransferase RsmD [Cyanobacteria bacterium P01_H01_bin.121]
MAIRIKGNRLLKSVPGNLTRPTLARVREAIFNIWQFELDGCYWLDLCAGSGSMGAEALCRGAAHVVGIEQAPKACQIIRQNWQRCTTAKQVFEVLQGDLLLLLPRLTVPFDKIYFDPPYASDLYEPTLQAIANLNVLAPGGTLAVEHHPKRQLPSIQGLEQQRQKLYGSTAVTFFTSS